MLASETTVATIGAIGLIVAAGISALPIYLGLRRARRENSEQHGMVAMKLGQLDGTVQAVHGEVRGIRKDFTNHLENHHRESMPTP